MLSGGTVISWKAYLNRVLPRGRSDERTLVGPSVFPRFAQALLGYQIGLTLGAEATGPEGRPDFTPADAATHPFVFELKGTDGGKALLGHHEQVLRYLTEGSQRIRRVALTNMVGINVYVLNSTDGSLLFDYAVDLHLLLHPPTDEQAAERPDAERLARFLSDFQHVHLSAEQKLERVRSAPPWNPKLELTAPDWVLQRLDSVVQIFTRDVAAQVMEGALSDSTTVPEWDTGLILRELRELDKRLGSADAEAEGRELADYLKARPTSRAGLALKQYFAHTAVYTATRLLLVRAWEDSGLLQPVALYDGGFDQLMTALDNVVEVVETAFSRAGNKYPDLFSRHNAFSWYTPAHDVYVDAIYELANTYLGALSDDVLGRVYERELARVDRKQLGQYYTPRDVISLMWDLLGFDDVEAQAESENRTIRVLDVSSGSGGFLVEAASRLRERFIERRQAGAGFSAKDFLRDVTSGLIGCEIQQFSAYLAEVNLVLQFSPLLDQSGIRLPSLRIHCIDTLTLHNPVAETLIDAAPEVADHGGLQQVDVVARAGSLMRLKDPAASDEWLDVAIGNPPYVGEASVAKTMAALRTQYPYWRQFSAAHQDYLYFFLILGVSKLRKGGRFAFITTEYWLKATGAAPLRKYLAQHTRIDHLVLFRKLTLFPDAPGQHNLIIIGERTSEPTGESSNQRATKRPKVSVYTGSDRRRDREATLESIRRGKTNKASGVASFTSTKSPSVLGAASWAELVMTAEQVQRREKVANYTVKANIVMSEGVIATPQALRANHRRHVSEDVWTRNYSDPARKGIFEVSPSLLSEIAGDDGLTHEEKAHVLRVIDTKDVYPYGAIIPRSGPSLIWLPSSHGGPNGEFPRNMPHLKSHLTLYRPLLEATVSSYDASRPWWSAHNPRLTLLEGHPDTGAWADLAVTTRWGDRKLVTGLAPAGTIPKSGLHAITGSNEETSAAYLVGLFNSTPILELAEALAPGSVSQEDIEALGLPQLPKDETRQIEASARSLADLVKGLVTQISRRWPDILETLREDPFLLDIPNNSWTPSAIARTWGTFGSIGWANLAITPGARGPVISLEITHDLFGPRLELELRTGHATVEVPHESAAVLLEAMQALISGYSVNQGAGRDLDEIPIPISPEDLLSHFRSDQEELEGAINEYRTHRALIDSTIARFI